MTIHNGKIVDADDADVWRTVNASGHLVFPGLIQPAPVDVLGALPAVRSGVTTAIGSGDEAGACLDLLDTPPGSISIIEPSPSGSLSDAQWQILLSDVPAHIQAPYGADFPIIHLLYHEGHVKRGMTLDRIAAVTSGNLARAAGVFPQKGSFGVGSDADLFVFDPETKDPYRDISWPGRVIFSLLRGKILLFNGQIHTSAGDGVAVT